MSESMDLNTDITIIRIFPILYWISLIGRIS